MRVTDPIIGRNRGTAKEAIAAARRMGAQRLDEVEGFIRTVYGLCAPFDSPGAEMPDAAIVVVAAFVETGNFQNVWWRKRLNAGSLGVTGDPAQDEASPTFVSGEDAAAAMVAHMLLYATGGIDRGRLTPADDPRYDAYRREYGERAMATTIAGLAGTWAANPNHAVAIVNRAPVVFANLPDVGAQEEQPMPEISFGRVPKPTMIELICPKPYDGAGFTRVAPRQIVGACDHITDGEPNDPLNFYYRFFGTGGERQFDALVDFVIDRDGAIAMLNNPFGTRSPWANGGSDGLEGDGPLYVRTLGVSAINARLASIEHVGRSPAPMTGPQLEASARLKAWLFDLAQVPWDQFPLNPNVGCVTHMQHFEFAQKPCPGSGIRGQTNVLQDRIRALLKAAQTGANVDGDDDGGLGSVPPPAPIEPDHTRYPTGMDRDIAATLFGVGKLYRPGKPTGGFGYHEGHAVSEAWLARGAETGTYPALVAWRQFEDAPGTIRHYVSFSDGAVLWRANSREGWRWL